jgi:hypothetical protein
MRRTILALAALAVISTVARADNVHDLLAAEGLLDGVCRGSVEVGDDTKFACKAREIVYEAPDKHNWCYGKIDQVGAEMRWHKCTKNSQRPTQEDFHAYDYESVKALGGRNCASFTEGQTVTLHGQIFQGKTLVEEEGEPPHKYLAIVLDRPICIGVDDRYSLLTVAIPEKWLGHSVVITGNMEGCVDGYCIDVKSIKDGE